MSPRITPGRGLAVGATALVFGLVGAGPALAQTPGTPPTQASPTERAAAEVRPAIFYLTETFTAHVVDQNGVSFNAGQAYQLSATCTGFGVNHDGYVATAGHCVDTTSPDGIKGQFVLAAAKEAVAARPDVTLADAYAFGSANWTVEGPTTGSPIDVRISVVSGSIEGGAQPRTLPARVVDYRPLGKGDVALLKVDTSDLPSLELGGDADVQVGTPLMSVGYPASADAVTDPSLEPSDKDGKISSKRTVGSMPVYETSAALTPGMSGGPTVDLQGTVLGVNSFMPAGESQPFNFVAPASGLTDLMTRNGVTNELGPEDRTYRAALDAYYAGHYTDAIARFDSLLQAAPEHAQAKQYREQAVKARDRFGDVPPPVAPSSGLPLGLSPAVFWSAVGGGGAFVVMLAVLLVLQSRHRPAGPAAPGALPMGPMPRPADPFGRGSFGPGVYAPTSSPLSPPLGIPAQRPAPASARAWSAERNSVVPGPRLAGSATPTRGPAWRESGSANGRVAGSDPGQRSWR